MSEEPKKKRKHRKHTINDFYHGNKLHKEKYGFIEIDNTEYYKKDNGYFAVPEFLLRKPTPEERKEIVVNYIIAHNGEYIDMFALADKLCISKRLMQTILKSFREEKIIEVIHTFDDNGKQLRNKYRYIGEPCERYGSGLTLDMLYDTENKAGFRDWDWEDYKFKKDGAWHELDDVADYKIGRRHLRRTYLESVNVGEAYGVKNAKYFVLRYSHWISNKENKPTPLEHIKLNHITGEMYDDRPGSFSADGTKKYELETLDKLFVFALFGVVFAAEYNGDKENPQIHLFDPRADEDYITFTYWGDNLLHLTWDANEDREHELQLIGEFTSK
jgi:hypothetical protein